MTNKKTLVIGASEEPSRYANMAIKSLRKHEHDVVAIGKTSGKVMDVNFDKKMEAFENVDTVTLYINPSRQEAYYDYILSLKPKRIIFNPGTENIELERIAEGEGIETMEACTLVLLSTGQY
ncbi:CoA-binding protein [Taibaiella lutea]|uniref:CoA-binding protein n=1 Tax=Taibaiella lutea TaxID=2608001 RepID=A0A5M6CPE8_9BACT|nr:CoA-binding protein [Taibaiella lutea]KAA5537014.1 CoA-binding protein [Taibaiella lutea]